jgi:hypothetical protein
LTLAKRLRVWRGDLGSQLCGHRDSQAVGGCEVHAGPVGQVLADVVFDAGLAARARPFADARGLDGVRSGFRPRAAGPRCMRFRGLWSLVAA